MVCFLKKSCKSDTDVESWQIPKKKKDNFSLFLIQRDFTSIIPMEGWGGNQYLDRESVGGRLIFGAELFWLSDDHLTGRRFEQLGQLGAEGVTEGEVFPERVACRADTKKRVTTKVRSKRHFPPGNRHV